MQTIVPPPPPSPAELVAFAKGRVAAIFAQLTEPADPAASDIAVANRQSLLNDQLTEAQDTLARARQLAASR